MGDLGAREQEADIERARFTSTSTPFVPRGEVQQRDKPMESDRLCPPSAGHHPFLDITRIMCVTLVAIDHGDPRFAKADVLFTQSWVMQYLYMICGVCLGLSKRSLLSYERRLAMLALVGIGMNWSAWLLMGLDWRRSVFNMVFQNWFVIGLMICSALLAPLRAYLQHSLTAEPAGGLVEDQPEMEPGGGDAPTDRSSRTDVQNIERLHQWSLMESVSIFGSGVLTLLVIFQVIINPLFCFLQPLVWSSLSGMRDGGSFWSLPKNEADTLRFLHQMANYLMPTCINVYLVVVGSKVLKRKSLTGWIVILNTYGLRMIFYRANDERPFHCLDLMIIGLTCHYLGLLHRRKLGEYVARYWFVVLFLSALIWPFGVRYRVDENPPVELSVRMRVNAVEAIFVVAWVVAGERFVSEEIFDTDRLDFMNDWALIVFLAHKAVHIVIGPPLNWVVIFGLMPVCYLRRHC